MSDQAERGDRLRIKAAAWNLAVAAGEAYRAGQLSGGVGDAPGVESHDTTIVRVKNTTASLLARRSVLAISSPLRSSSSAEWGNAADYNGIAPATGKEGKFVILREHAPEGATVEAAIAGVAKVSVNVVSSSHTRAEIEPGRTDRLISSDTGSAQILWIGGTSGVQPAVVRLGGKSAVEQRYEFAAHQTAVTTATPVTGTTYQMDLPVMKYLDYNLGKAWKYVDDYTIECQVAGTYRFLHYAMAWDRSTENPWPDNSPLKRYVWDLQVQPHWCKKVSGSYSWTLHSAGSTHETMLTPGIQHIYYRGYVEELRFTAHAFDIADIPVTGRVRLIVSGIGLVSPYCEIAGRIQISRLGDIPVLPPDGTDEQGTSWTGT